MVFFNVYCLVSGAVFCLQTISPVLGVEDGFDAPPAEEARAEIIAFQKRWEADVESFPRVRVSMWSIMITYHTYSSTN